MAGAGPRPAGGRQRRPDAPTLSRLNRARQAAVARHRKPQRAAWPWAAGVAVAAACAVALLSPGAARLPRRQRCWHRRSRRPPRPRRQRPRATPSCWRRRCRRSGAGSRFLCPARRPGSAGWLGPTQHGRRAPACWCWPWVWRAARGRSPRARRRCAWSRRRSPVLVGPEHRRTRPARPVADAVAAPVAHQQQRLRERARQWARPAGGAARGTAPASAALGRHDARAAPGPAPARGGIQGAAAGRAAAPARIFQRFRSCRRRSASVCANSTSAFRRRNARPSARVQSWRARRGHPRILLYRFFYARDAARPFPTSAAPSAASGAACRCGARRLPARALLGATPEQCARRAWRSAALPGTP